MRYKKLGRTGLIGARNPAQLKDNLAATSIRLSAEELAALDRVSELPEEYAGLDAHVPKR
jgi:aryl-alcohol dehydrogenase-like predicted oxidoreductase